jgi:hypothetical protein
MSLDVKEAIVAAREHFLHLLPEIVKSGEVKEGEARLEEIERDGDNWAVTLSVPYRETSSNLYVKHLGGGSSFGYNRLAKIVVVDGSTGRFVALKQRAA